MGAKCCVRAAELQLEGPQVVEQLPSLPEPKAWSPRPPDLAGRAASRSPQSSPRQVPRVAPEVHAELEKMGITAPLQRVAFPKPFRPQPDLQRSVPVLLHVYNIGTQSLGHSINRVLKPLGTGLFHCGVEIHGCEWSYSDTKDGLGDGIFPSRPRCCAGHSYCESVPMGEAVASEDDVKYLIHILKPDWSADRYSLLTRNCCHFSNEFCQRLGLGRIPHWVMNLAGAGAAIAASGDLTCCRQVAAGVGTACCCAADGGKSRAGSTVELVDVVEQRPVLSARSNQLSARGGSKPAQ